MADRRGSRAKSPGDADRSGARSRAVPTATRGGRKSISSEAPQGAGSGKVQSKHELETLFEGWAGDQDVMRRDGIEKMANDLQLPQGVDDTAILMLAWKIHAMECWTITRGEWYHGLSSLTPPVDNHAKLKAYLSSTLRETTEADQAEFEEFYNYLYDFVREDPSQHLDQELCRRLWKQLLAGRWSELAPWCEYLEKEHGGDKRVSRDLWQQVLEFALTVPRIDDHSIENSTFPVVIDDFVKWKRKKQQK